MRAIERVPSFPPEATEAGVGAKAWVAVVLFGALAAGCARPEDPAELAELEQVKRDSAAINASLDDVGTRLLEGQHLVSMDADLKERHQHVSQVACQNLSDHWAGINRFLDNQREKAKKKRVARVAQAERAPND